MNTFSVYWQLNELTVSRQKLVTGWRQAAKDTTIWTLQKLAEVPRHDQRRRRGDQEKVSWAAALPFQLLGLPMLECKLAQSVVRQEEVGAAQGPPGGRA